MSTKKKYGEYKLVLRDNTINIKLFEEVDNDLNRLAKKFLKYFKEKYE